MLFVFQQSLGCPEFDQINRTGIPCFEEHGSGLSGSPKKAAAEKLVSSKTAY